MTPGRWGGRAQYAVELDRDRVRVRWECGACGHRYWTRHGPDAPLRHRIALAMLVRFFSYWSRENNGAAGSCPRCVKHSRRATGAHRR